MITLEQLKQKLTDNADYQTLVRSGVIPNDIRWDPQVDVDTQFAVENGKTIMTITLAFRQYPEANVSSRNSRKIAFAELLSEEEAVKQIPNDDWLNQSKAKWEHAQLSNITAKI